MPVGTAGDLMVGETVIAIGNAFGYQHTVSVGIVSAINRDVTLNKDVSYRALIRTYEALCATVKPARVVGIALNTRDCTPEEAAAQIERARAETGLPCDDVVRNGPQGLYDAIAPSLEKTEVLKDDA